MSGIAGIFNANGAPVSPETLGRMADALRHRGPDGSGLWTRGDVALTHLMLHTTPESLQEEQPLRDETGTLCLVMDGRVDDREGLTAELKRKGAVLRDCTDAELVLKAYAVWGQECPTHIIGDFAFAVWDQREQRLFCARDFIGAKPFFYCLGFGRFAFASELHALFSVPGVTSAVNEGMVGEFLAAQITNREETLYRDIRTLMPGHSITLARESYGIRRFWNIDPHRKLNYKTDDEYAEHFREILSEAIRCRLRTYGRAGAYLSGGLDSSTIIALSKSLLDERRIPPCGFETFSNIFPSAPEADESNYINDVVDKCGFPSNVLCPVLPDHEHHVKTVQQYRYIPEYPNGSLGISLRELAAEKGFRVLLAGYGGDEWLCTTRDYYADLLRGFSVRELLAHFRREEQVSVLSRRFVSVLVNHGLKPLLPFGLREKLRNLKHGSPDPWPWINKEFADRINLRERVEAELPPPSGLSLTKQATYYSFMVGSAAQSLEMEDRASAASAIEQRYPFHDRRFVEFAFALPEQQRWRFGQKFILRQAMRGLLPESVRLRRDKADFSRFHPEALRQVAAHERVRSLAISKAGWVSETEVQRTLAEMESLYSSGNQQYKLLKGPLWMVYSVELWSRLCAFGVPPV